MLSINCAGAEEPAAVPYPYEDLQVSLRNSEKASLGEADPEGSPIFAGA